MAGTAQVIAPDLTTFITNLGVFSLAVAAAVAGIWKAIREIKKADAPDVGHRVASATIVETHTMVAWTESNRIAAEHIKELCHEVAELRHQIERLRDKM